MSRILNRTCKHCGTDYHDPGGPVGSPDRHCPKCGSRAWYAGPAIARRSPDMECPGCGADLGSFDRLADIAVHTDGCPNRELS